MIRSIQRDYPYMLTLILALPAAGQTPREDAIWARSTGGAPITLDGVLDEPAWALAESVVIEYPVNAGLPGSSGFATWAA